MARHEAVVWKKALATHIRQFMENEGINRITLARRLRCTPSMVTKLLSGNNNFTIELYIRVLECVGQRIEEITYRKIGT